MKENLTAIVVIMDKSGSMAGLTLDTIGSFNQFLSEQKVVPGEAVFSLCTFNTDYSLVHDFLPLQSVSELTNKTYHCEGGTALLDAMGTTIDSVGSKLNAMPEQDRPSKVVVLVITDGEENSSKHFSLEQIKAKVALQTDTYNWQFLFFGANIDAIKAGVSLGVASHNSLNYEASAIGTRSVYNTASASISSYRTTGVLNVDVDLLNQPPVDVIPPVSPVPTPPVSKRKHK
jgi:uncharacterized protein YegL